MKTAAKTVSKKKPGIKPLATRHAFHISAETTWEDLMAQAKAIFDARRGAHGEAARKVGAHQVKFSSYLSLTHPPLAPRGIAILAAAAQEADFQRTLPKKK